MPFSSPPSLPPFRICESQKSSSMNWDLELNENPYPSVTIAMLTIVRPLDKKLRVWDWADTTPPKWRTGMRTMWLMRWRPTRHWKAWLSLPWSSTFLRFKHLWIYRSFISSHTAHEGGSDPNEKNHITASFYNKQTHVIPNSFNGGVCIIFAFALSDRRLIIVFQFLAKSPHIRATGKPRYDQGGSEGYEKSQCSSSSKWLNW